MGKYLDLIAEAADAWRPPLTRYEEKEKNELNRITSFNSFSSYSFDPPKRVEFGRFGRTFPLARTLEVLEQRCPDHVPLKHWQQATEDGRRFLIRWGEQAERLGWTARDLFGLHQPPADPHPSYSRLSRYDAIGLIWLLRGRSVIALTKTGAAIENPTGAVTVYRR